MVYIVVIKDLWVKSFPMGWEEDFGKFTRSEDFVYNCEGNKYLLIKFNKIV